MVQLNTLHELTFAVSRTWKNLAPKAEGMPSIGIDYIATGEKTKFIRWKAHGDWVQQVSKSTTLLGITTTQKLCQLV